MSHALADGAASKRLLETLYADAPFDLESAADGSPRPWAGEGEAMPSRWTLLKNAARDRARAAIIDLPRVARATRAARRALRDKPVTRFYQGRRISMLASPTTPFSGRPSEKRAFHFVTVSLDEARDMRLDLGCTVTDVILATTAGAVRRYLEYHRALPGLPTLAHLPASIRTDDECHAWGNRIDIYTTFAQLLGCRLSQPN